MFINVLSFSYLFNSHGEISLKSLLAAAMCFLPEDI